MKYRIPKEADLLSWWIGNYWRSDDPWEPGIDFEYRIYHRKQPERTGRFKIEGPTYLDELYLLACEALKFLDDRKTP